MHIDINTRRVETEACSGTWSLVCGGAYKSLARPTSRCRRTESIVSLERGVCSCCRIASHLLLQGMKWSTSGDAREFNNIKTRAVIEFFPCKARRRRKFTPFWQKHVETVLWVWDRRKWWKTLIDLASRKKFWIHIDHKRQQFSCPVHESYWQ